MFHSLFSPHAVVRLSTNQQEVTITVHVLDTGGFGSTTDIWAIPR